MNRVLLHRRHFLLLSTSACLAALTSSCARQNSGSQPSSFDPKAASWDQIVTAAKGTTVNWAMWGGSDKTNAYADQWIAEQLNSQYFSLTIYQRLFSGTHQ